MEIKFTKNQQLARDSEGSNIVVSAGAGSGKTQVLTARVLHFIKDKGYKLDNMLVLTFTKLAAKEMKERIRKALLDNNLEEADNVDSANIQTFDAFALSLLKKYSNEMNVSPSVRVFEPNVIAVKTREYLEEVLEQEYANRDSKFTTMIDRFCSRDDKIIRDIILEFYEASRLKLDTHEYWQEYISNYFSDKYINQLFAELLTIFKHRKKLIFGYLDSFDGVLTQQKKDLREECQELLTSLASASTYEEYLSSLTNFSKLPNLAAGTDQDVKDLKEEFKGEIDELKTIFAQLPVNKEELKESILENKSVMEAILQIVQILDEKLEEYKEQNQVFDFIDIEKMVLELVKTKPKVCQAIKRQYKMILVDEYQDTSDLQDELLRYISNQNVYMVGDIKQSIYRFRNANYQLFLEKMKSYEQDHKKGLVISMNENFRARKELLSGINAIFTRIMTEEYGGVDYYPDHLLTAGNANYEEYKEEIDYDIDFLLTKTDNRFDDHQANAENIARDIIDKINHHYKVMRTAENNNSVFLEDCKYSDFCILIDRGTQFEIYAKVFKEYQLPLYVQQDENVVNNNIVMALTSLISLVRFIMLTRESHLAKEEYHEEFKKYKNAFVSVARSFICEYDDEYIFELCKDNSFTKDPLIKKLSRCVEQYSLRSISDLLERVFLEVDIFHKCIVLGDVEVAEAYLDQYMDLFKSMSELDYDIDKFIHFMDYVSRNAMPITLSNTGTSVNSIRLMNIHKAKGLEFNIVYYTELKGLFNFEDLKKKIGYTKAYEMIFPRLDLEKISPLMILNQEKERKAIISEKVRLFYVALTRAKQKAIIVYPSKDNQEFYFAMHKREYLRFIKEHKLDGLEKQAAMKEILQAYQRKEICYTVLRMLVLHLDYQLPYKFLLLSEPEMLNTPFEAIIEWEKTQKVSEANLQKLQPLIDNGCHDANAYFAGYKAREINLEELEVLLATIGIRLTKEFDPSAAQIDPQWIIEGVPNPFENNEIQKRIDCNDKLYEKEEEPKDLVDISNAKSFFDFIFQSYRYRKSNAYVIDDEIEAPRVSKAVLDSKVEYEKIVVETVPLTTPVEIEIERASRDLDLDSPKKDLEAGKRLHFVMEIIDFNNPNYAILDGNEVRIVKQFLDWDRIKNIKDGVVYKEYAFFDEDNQHRGIIDLFIEYPDHIDIIDYKTKNIQGKDYDWQLGIYRDFIFGKFQKPTYAYVYSLEEGIARKIESQ